MKILVTGSTGQLGNELNVLAQKQDKHIFEFKSRDEFDLSSEASIKTNLQNQYDYIINAGAYTKVDQAETEAELCYTINADALYHIARNASPKTRIIHVSSDYVYNSISDRPLVEEDPTNPVGEYAKSKRDGEANLLGLRPDSLVIRTSWVYSSFGHNFIKSMLRLGSERDRLNIVSDQIGAPTYARDIADVIIRLLDQPELAGIFNFANLGQTHWANYARKIFEFTGIQCDVGEITTAEFNAPAHRPKWSVMDCSKIQNALNFTIPMWDESLKKCLLELGFEL